MHGRRKHCHTVSRLDINLDVRIFVRHVRGGSRIHAVRRPKYQVHPLLGGLDDQCLIEHLLRVVRHYCQRFEYTDMPLYVQVDRIGAAGSTVPHSDVLILRYVKVPVILLELLEPEPIPRTLLALAQWYHLVSLGVVELLDLVYIHLDNTTMSSSRPNRSRRYRLSFSTAVWCRLQSSAKSCGCSFMRPHRYRL